MRPQLGQGAGASLFAKSARYSALQSASVYVISVCGSRSRLTKLRISCGRSARRFEFYGPLFPTGEELPSRAISARSRQVHALVRPLVRLANAQIQRAHIKTRLAIILPTVLKERESILKGGEGTVD